MTTPRHLLIPALLLALSACAADPGTTTGASAAGPATPDAGAAAVVSPTLRAGVDPTIFQPRVIAGYHPTEEEIATSGRACTTDEDCATTVGLVVFHCSTPYYGSAQCQGAFPPGDQVVPGVAPSCVYYECPAAYECETEVESGSVGCVAHQHQHGGRDAGP